MTLPRLWPYAIPLWLVAIIAGAESKLPFIETVGQWAVSEPDAFSGLAVTAFTFVLAVSTILLWVTTKKAADAAEKSAAVAVASVLPVVRIADIRAADWKECTGGGVHYRTTFLRFIFENKGSSAATVTQFATGVGIGELVPTYPPLTRDWTIKEGLFIAPNDRAAFEKVGYELAVTEEQWEKIISEEWRLRAWGTLRYRDILAGETEIGFLWRYLPVNNKFGLAEGFIERAHPDYTYHRTIS